METIFHQWFKCGNDARQKCFLGHPTYQSSLFSWVHWIGDNWRQYRIFGSASHLLRLDLSDPDEREDCKQTSASADPHSILAHLELIKNVSGNKNFETSFNGVSALRRVNSCAALHL